MKTMRTFKRLTALLCSLLMLFTLLTPFSVLAATNDDGYEEVLRFSKFEKTYSSTASGNIYADWTQVNNQKVDITEGHTLENLRLQLKFTLTKPQDTLDLTTTWNKGGFIKLRSEDAAKPDDPELKENGGTRDSNTEHNYGWDVNPKSNNAMRLHTGENELLIPLVGATDVGYSVNKRGLIDWTKLDRILFSIEGLDMHASDHSMAVTYAAIVDVGEPMEPAPTVEMPTLFGDNMMFQQGKDIKVWGWAEDGESITVSMQKQGTNETVRTGTTTAANGSWSVTLDALDASYQAYDMTVTASGNGSTVRSKTISDILIGEVWVAAGQSNMEALLKEDLYANEYVATANNDNIRLFWEPQYPFGQKNAQPVEPEDDLPGAYWGTAANDGDVWVTSSVGYHFAVSMQQKLNVPVGILYTPVGGSAIENWIPKDAIDADAEYKQFLENKGKYYDENNWPEQGNRMSALYNQKIGPLAGYNAAGVIWYQGESNVNEPEIYAHALTLLRDTWNEVFGFTDDEDMPFVFTMVQPWREHLEDPQRLAYLAEGMYDGWKANEERNMAMISLYDIPLYFLDRTGRSSNPIHPRDKQPVGQRFATAAYNMVYETADVEYTAPVYESHLPVDTDGDGINDAIDVTFAHAGDGLEVINAVYVDDEFGYNKGDGLEVLSPTEDVHGFAIAGNGGVYVDAKAKITGKNTVRVWSDGVKNPVGITYNFVSYYNGGTLKNSIGLPVIPFRSDRSDTAMYFNMQDWKYADANIWTPYTVNNSEEWASFEDAWSILSGTGEWSYDADVKAEGRASVKVAYSPDASTGMVGVGPVFGLWNVTNQFENFDTIAVSVKNGDARAKVMELCIRSGGKVYTAAIAEDFAATTDNKVTLSISDDFVTYTFSLRHLFDDVSTLLTDTNTILQNVEQLQFAFADTEAGTVYVDDVRFGFLYDENVDKNALQQDLKNALDQSLYTSASWALYAAANQSAQVVYEDPVASQAQVDRVTSILQEQRLSLVEINEVATFSAFERTTESKNDIYTNWTKVDNAPIDLTDGHRLEDLRLQIKFTLTAPEDVEETVTTFNNSGYIKLRSVNTPDENNYGWNMSTSDTNPIRLHSGENALSIPLVNTTSDGYSTTSKGQIDWTQLNEINMMVSSSDMKGRDGEFSLTVTDVKIVDISVNNERKAVLKSVIDQAVDTSSANEQTVAAYQSAKAAAQAVCDDEMATLTDIDQAQKTLRAAISSLNADRTALDEAIAAAKAVKADGKNYSAVSMTALNTALQAAEALSDTASQQDVDEAEAALTAAMAGLRYTLGDVDGDSSVAAADALLVLQAATKKVTLTAIQEQAANTDGGDIAASDALMILQAATKKITLA